MPQTFDAGLAQHVASLPPSLNKRRLQNLLALPPSNWRRQNAMLRLEGEARAQLGIADDVDVDWSEGIALSSTATINWTQILQLIAQLLPIIIQILGGA